MQIQRIGLFLEMAAIRNFFQKRKLDRRFKQAGEGHKLCDETPKTTGSIPGPSSSGSRAGGAGSKGKQRSESTSKAAEAALARNASANQAKPTKPMSSKTTWKNISQMPEGRSEKKIKIRVETATKSNNEIESPPMLSSISFACPLCPACLPENEIKKHIEGCLHKEIDSEPAMVAATMIHTLNDKRQVLPCIETLNKYLENIIKNPGEEKYRKIRIDNKVFKEKVKDVKGVKELLTVAVGFVQVKLPANDGETEEDFYLLSEGLAMESERLEIIKGYINEAEPLTPGLDRNVKVYRPVTAAASLDFPSDFYAVSNQEIKREQQQKTEDLEKSKQLRTKAMKEAEIQNKKKFYRFTLIRIRFPDDHILQGTFFSKDKFSEVLSFVRESLEIDWLPFELCDATGKKIHTSEMSLEALGLSPAAVLNFSWDQSIAEDMKGTNINTDQCLTSELLARVIEL